MEKARIDSKSCLSQMLDILGKHDFNTKIQAASLRLLEQIVQCAALSLPAITLKEELFDVLIQDHPHKRACLPM
ncbi:MAG: hypothetical protein LLG04_02810 [Parachlamydia sp.]|nr:hypothetical protein [Parachlamydia sp.]